MTAEAKKKGEAGLVLCPNKNKNSGEEGRALCEDR